jgi:hypothetical protein
MTRVPSALLKLAILVAISASLTVGHFIYNHDISLALFAHSGGVHTKGKWTTYGGTDYAWTTPLYLPGCLVLHLGQKLHGVSEAAQPYGLIGVSLLFVASAISGWSLASVALAAMLRDRDLLGWRWYRVWLAVGGWIWVYVPVEWTWVYQWTIVY